MKVVIDGVRNNAGQLREQHAWFKDLLEREAQVALQRGDDPRKVRTSLTQAANINLIVGCYALIEQTVNTVIVASAEQMEDIYPTHSKVPEDLTKTRRRLILQCLMDGGRSRVTGYVDEKDALGVIGASGAEKNKMMATVFTYSSANYRYPYIREQLGRLDLSVADKGLFTEVSGSGV